jgi:hypothetical protein
MQTVGPLLVNAGVFLTPAHVHVSAWCIPIMLTMSNHLSLITTPYFTFDGRGPTRTRWITQAALCLPETLSQMDIPLDDIVGAQYEAYSAQADTYCGPAWVIFSGIQVFLTVPEEVHSYWHRDLIDPGRPYTGVWQVSESTWMQLFHPRHLGDHHHFIIEFYDEIVEVICRNLVFGQGTFAIEEVVERDGRFAEAYIRAAQACERFGDIVSAVRHYRQYLALGSDSRAREYAARSLARLTTPETREKQGK